MRCVVIPQLFIRISVIRIYLKFLMDNIYGKRCRFCANMSQQNIFMFFYVMLPKRDHVARNVQKLSADFIWNRALTLHTLNSTSPYFINFFWLRTKIFNISICTYTITVRVDKGLIIQTHTKNVNSHCKINDFP